MVASGTRNTLMSKIQPFKLRNATLAGQLVAVVLLSLLGIQAAQSKPQDYLNGMDAYNKRDYATAKKFFVRMVQDTPDDSLGHYYLANTMVFLKDTAGASREYQTAIDNADSDDLKGNCEAALKSLKTTGVKGAAATLKASVTVPGGAPGAGAAAGTVPGAGAGPGAVPGAGTVSGAVPGGATGGGAASGAASVAVPGTPGGATGAIGAATPAAAIPPENQTLMQRQAEDRKREVARQTELQQKSILDAAKQQATRIKTDYTVDPSMTYRRGGRAYADQMKKEGDSQAQSVMKRANQQAADYKKYVDEKKAVLDDVVNNLDSQMNQTGGASKIHLKKEGTNLHVRNYEFSH